MRRVARISARIGSLLTVACLLGGCGPTRVVGRDPSGEPILIRCAQPSAGQIEEMHARYGIRTVLNLRGEEPAEGWWNAEVEAVERIGGRLVDVELSGQYPPTEDQLEAIFDLIEDRSSWPILVHCQGGIHRTGLVTALYRIQYQGWTEEAAIAELEANLFDFGTTDRRRVKRFLKHFRRRPERTLPYEDGADRKP